MAMEDVVIRGRCGGVGVFGGVWELRWCMRDMVVYERYGGVWEMWWCMGDAVSMEDVVIRCRCGGVELSGVHGSCVGEYGRCGGA